MLSGGTGGEEGTADCSTLYYDGCDEETSVDSLPSLIQEGAITDETLCWSQDAAWPFDGWTVPVGKSVIAEIYPSIFRRRYPKHDRTADQQDAYSVCRWLTETDQRGMLQHYLNPPLTESERKIAEREGWILGVN